MASSLETGTPRSKNRQPWDRYCRQPFNFILGEEVVCTHFAALTALTVLVALAALTPQTAQPALIALTAQIAQIARTALTALTAVH